MCVKREGKQSKFTWIVCLGVCGERLCPSNSGVQSVNTRPDRLRWWPNVLYCFTIALPLLYRIACTVRNRLIELDAFVNYVKRSRKLRFNIVMAVQLLGVGNLCGGLFTILMLIIMFSVAHHRFQELIYISLALIAVILTLCIIFAIINTVIKGGPLIDFWDTCSSSRHSVRNRYHTNHNTLANAYNQFNQQRVHVCAPPTMGGARLNIIYTIGE